MTQAATSAVPYLAKGPTVLHTTRVLLAIATNDASSPESPFNGKELIEVMFTLYLFSCTSQITLKTDSLDEFKRSLKTQASNNPSRPGTDNYMCLGGGGVIQTCDYFQVFLKPAVEFDQVLLDLAELGGGPAPNGPFNVIGSVLGEVLCNKPASEPSGSPNDYIEFSVVPFHIC